MKKFQEYLTAHHNTYSNSKPRLYWEYHKTASSLVKNIIAGKPFDWAVLNVIKKLGEQVEADRTYVFSYDERTNTISCTHEWHSSNTSSLKDTLQNIDISQFQWGKKKLNTEGYIFIHDTSNLSHLPPEAQLELKKLLAPDTKSIAILKIGSENLLGFIGISCCKTRHDWTEEEIDFLAYIASAIECAITFKKMQRKTCITRKRIESVLSQGDLLVCCFDKDGVLTYANEAYCDFFGFKKEELLGKDFFFLIPNEYRQKVRNEFLSLSPQKPFTTYEHQVLTKDGSLRWQRWTDMALFDEDNSILEYQSIGIDITEQKETHMKLEKALKQLREAFNNSIEAMGRILEIKDPYTANHQKRVAILSRRIAQEMNLNKKEVELIYLGALVHDIGKIYVPSELLSKPAKLSKLEFELLKNHTLKGEEILRPLSKRWPIWEAAAYHHERIDGSGYPRGLKGEDIPLGAKIIAVADVVEAMTSHRPYRPARSLEEALNELRKGMGTKYDPEAAKICIKLFEKGLFSFEGNSQN